MTHTKQSPEYPGRFTGKYGVHRTSYESMSKNPSNSHDLREQSDSFCELSQIVQFFINWKLIFVPALCFFLISCTNTSERLSESMPKSEDHGGISTKTKLNDQPNILLIVADDLGISDIGVYGGEISTPNIDALARAGVIFTQFFASPNCSPTRAMLFSGMDSHLAGLGNMKEEVIFVSNQNGRPGYEGYLNSRVASLGELLRDAGYHTYMTGKWHLGESKDTNPVARGFEKSFALLEGGAGHFNMMANVGPAEAKYEEDGEKLDSLPENFYSSRFFTEKLIEYIDGDLRDGKPFFAFLAFTAPHWPLQAPDESIAKYSGKYDSGYGALQAKRLSRARAIGLAPESLIPYPRMESESAWEELTESERKVESRKMEIYAAMIDDLDRYVGVLVEFLKEKEEFDNTFILFMSDNGPEGHHLENGWDSLAEWVETCCNNSYENLGKPSSYVWYGPNWAQASAVPYRMFKGFTSDGGILVPAFVHYPKLHQTGVIHSKFLTVKDVMPTFLELAGTEHPGANYRGRQVLPMQGTSMLAMLNGDIEATHDSDYVMGWELFGRRAIRQGDWKILWEPSNKYFEPLPKGIEADKWQLFNLAEDPAEINDLSDRYPEKKNEMVDLWEVYVTTNNVILPNWSSGY